MGSHVAQTSTDQRAPATLDTRLELQKPFPTTGLDDLQPLFSSQEGLGTIFSLTSSLALMHLV